MQHERRTTRSGKLDIGKPTQSKFVALPENPKLPPPPPLPPPLATSRESPH